MRYLCYRPPGAGKVQPPVADKPPGWKQADPLLPKSYRPIVKYLHQMEIADYKIGVCSWYEKKATWIQPQCSASTIIFEVLSCKIDNQDNHRAKESVYLRTNRWPNKSVARSRETQPLYPHTSNFLESISVRSLISNII